jgi:uncharacterized protein (DUF1697 family)
MMTKYVSILRGINVSGHKKILMADLKILYQDLGFENVICYIQSGNVIFDSATKGTQEIKLLIEQAIENHYQFQVPVIIRLVDEIEEILLNDPFPQIDKIENGAKLHVVFLSEEPTTKPIEDLQEVVQLPEKMIVIKNNAYVWYAAGCGRSKLTTALIERKLKVQATARNWKTLTKLYELSR